MSDNVYFEPSSRLQLVDKLAHLLRFSNVFLALTGPQGAGLTTVLEQLNNCAIADDLYILSLDLKSKTATQNLLDMLNSSLDELIDTSEETPIDALSKLHQRIESITSLQRKIFISLDNADYLSSDAVLTLLNLLVANEGMISIVVAGSENSALKTSELALKEGVSERHYIEVLHPFNRLETEEFIQLNFVRGSDFSSRQISAIFADSKGYPGRIARITSQMIKSGKVTLNSTFSFLPVPHMMGIAFLLSVITGVLAWQSFSEEALIAGDNKLNQELVLDINQENSLTLELDEHNNQALTLEEEIANLSNEIKSQQALIESAEQASDEGSVVDLANELSLVDSEETMDASLDGQSTEQLLAVQTGNQNIDAIVGLDVDENSNNLQVDQTSVNPSLQSTTDLSEAQLTVENEAAVKNTGIKNANTSAQTMTKNNDETLAAQQLKLAPSKISIAIKLQQLSKQLKQNIDPSLLEEAPSTETISKGVVIKESSISVKQQSTSNASSTLKKPTEINKSNKEVASKTVSSSIQKWPNNAYTLQLISAKSKQNISQFLNTMPNSEKMHYVQTLVKGKPWHVIVYGQYASRSLAKSAIAKLPTQLRALKPWPKSVNSVKNSIRK